ncbi:unnamed protein product [Linum trigynum]|uniref:Secreted protein n=1 Tax=Linum trigynum TaxID=586398 RepID=A0AAV2DZ99_9ROSI
MDETCWSNMLSRFYAGVVVFSLCKASSYSHGMLCLPMRQLDYSHVGVHQSTRLISNPRVPSINLDA